MTEYAALHVWGARLAQAREQHHNSARDAKPSKRQIRRDIIREVTAPANVKAVREQEHDRDLAASR